MKRLLFILFVCGSLCSYGQVINKYSLSYLGHFAYQPGFKFGMGIMVKSILDQETRNGDNRYHSFYLEPTVGAFSRVNYNLNTISGVNFIWNTRKYSNLFYSNVGLGANYLFQSEVVTTSVDLQGNTIQKERDGRHFFVPTISYGFGRFYKEPISWFLNFVAGMKMNKQNANSMMLFVEAGLCFHVFKKMDR